MTGQFESLPNVFAFAKRVLESMGVTEWTRSESNMVELCREGDEGSSVTVILHDNPWLEWEQVLYAVRRSGSVGLVEFEQRAAEFGT